MGLIEAFKEGRVSVRCDSLKDAEKFLELVEKTGLGIKTPEFKSYLYARAYSIFFWVNVDEGGKLVYSDENLSNGGDVSFARFKNVVNDDVRLSVYVSEYGNDYFKAKITTSDGAENIARVTVGRDGTMAIKVSAKFFDEKEMDAFLGALKSLTWDKMRDRIAKISEAKDRLEEARKIEVKYREV